MNQSNMDVKTDTVGVAKVEVQSYQRESKEDKGR